ncbi:LON peptidase substrate-binding domain-containing protein [Cetobacterium sp. 2A]|uniref:LON peptidase substrate-binding domain-containing protein n=1 Tax=Cetobacterium sp. 2A TaxID=2754723 RepID=UPI00163C5CA7|nr:LON peptidase substrate-binding domain-containing protein [Cetobacterium sp. 2A]
MSQVSYDRPGILIDLISSMLKTEGKELQTLLEEFDLEHRFEKIINYVKKRVRNLTITNENI